MKACQRQAIAQALQESRFPFTVLIDSGGKSIHAVIRLADSVPAIMQAREPNGLHDRLQEALWIAFGNFDVGVYDQGGKWKLVRAPGALRDGKTPQTILAVNPEPVTYQRLMQWAEAQMFPEVAAELAGRPPCRRPEMQGWRMREGFKEALRGPWLKGGRGTRWFQVVKEMTASGNLGLRGDGTATFLWWFSALVTNTLSDGWFFSSHAEDQDTQKERRYTFADARQFKAEKDDWEAKNGRPPEVKALAAVATEASKLAMTLTPPEVVVSKGKKKGGGGSSDEDEAAERNLRVITILFEQIFPNGTLVKMPIKYGGEWLRYNGKRWEVYDAESIIHHILRIAGIGTTERQAKDALAHVAGIAMLKGRFPSPKDAIVFNNGTLYLTSEDGCHPEFCFLEDHFDMYDYVTTFIPRDYKPTASCPKFLAWLATVQPDEKVRAVLQEFTGTIFVPDNRFNAFALNYGSGGNGKSTFLGVLESMIGPDNKGTISLAQLCDPFHIGYHHDRLLLYDDDVSRTVLKSANGGNCGDILKAITGNVCVPVQKKFGPIHDALVRGTIFLNCNQKPHWATSPDAGFWRRLLIFPWDVTFEGQEQANFVQKFSDEMDGVATWALTGLQRLMARQGKPLEKDTMLRGFTRSERMIQEVEDFQAEADPLKMFAQSYLVESQDRHSWYCLIGVFNAYKAYCTENDIAHIPTFHQFAAKMNNLKSGFKFITVGRPRASEPGERPLDLPLLSDPKARYNHSYRGFTCTHPAFKRPIALPSGPAIQPIQACMPPPLRVVVGGAQA
jgi:P4 family phage/plasmid primase-like protien